MKGKRKRDQRTAKFKEAAVLRMMEGENEQHSETVVQTSRVPTGCQSRDQTGHPSVDE